MALRFSPTLFLAAALIVLGRVESYISLMHSSARHARPLLESDDDQKILHIAIFSDGNAARRRASQSVEALMQTLKPEFEFDFRFSPMNSLGSEESGQTSAFHMRWADVIVFSFSDATRMNKKTKQWIEASLESDRRQPQALAVLCSTGKRHSDSQPPSLVEFLRNTASRRRIDFFAEVRHVAVSPGMPPSSKIFGD
jgi:hypothetical protein